jgi:two-component system, chemotaxis family, sensor kinase CheA
MAERSGKELLPAVIEGDVDVTDGPYHNLTKSFVHIVRNIVDHGLEDTVVRQGLGKPATGQIKYKIAMVDNIFKIMITDDGGGIDADKIRMILAEQGLDTTGISDHDIIQHIFHSASRLAHRSR